MGISMQMKQNTMSFSHKQTTFSIDKNKFYDLGQHSNYRCNAVNPKKMFKKQMGRVPGRRATKFSSSKKRSYRRRLNKEEQRKLNRVAEGKEKSSTTSRTSSPELVRSKSVQNRGAENNVTPTVPHMFQPVILRRWTSPTLGYRASPTIEPFREPIMHRSPTQVPSTDKPELLTVVRLSDMPDSPILRNIATALWGVKNVKQLQKGGKTSKSAQSRDGFELPSHRL